MPETASPARVVIVGYGLAGRVFHSRLIAAEPGLTIAAVVTSDPERAAQARAEVPGALVLATADEAWARSGDFDVAIIATANSAHVPQARAALGAGLHVVVDKPLAGTAAEAQGLIDAAAAAGRQLHVFQNRRWDSEIITVQRAIDEGLLGRVHRWESRFERWRPTPKGGWREDGPAEDLPGLLYDLGSHLVDQALHVMGPVVRVYASVRAVRDGQVTDDDTQVFLAHESGAVSLLSVSSVAALREPRLRVLGTAGGIDIIGLDTQEVALRSGTDPKADGWGTEPSEAAVTLVTAADPQPRSIPRSPGAWPEYYRGVARAIADGAPAPVDPADAVANLRVIEAAVRSGRDGVVVDLDPPAAHVP
ncbi:MAG: Gfo/Idh/MocA family oxidoreductase [bacterium]